MEKRINIFAIIFCVLLSAFVVIFGVFIFKWKQTDSKLKDATEQLKSTNEQFLIDRHAYQKRIEVYKNFKDSVESVIVTNKKTAAKEISELTDKTNEELREIANDPL